MSRTIKVINLKAFILSFTLLLGLFIAYLPFGFVLIALGSLACRQDAGVPDRCNAGGFNTCTNKPCTDGDWFLGLGFYPLLFLFGISLFLGIICCVIGLNKLKNNNTR